MEKNIKRFHLYFHLDREEEALAAMILDRMGHKKTALVSMAIRFLYTLSPEEIHRLKNYDYSNPYDLLLRGLVGEKSAPKKEKASEGKKGLRSMPQRVETSSSGKTFVHEENGLQKKSALPNEKTEEEKDYPPPEEVKKDEKESTPEEDASFDDLLEGLDAFF